MRKITGKAAAFIVTGALTTAVFLPNISARAQKLFAQQSEDILNYDIYVSPQGNDSTGDGSQSNPFATLERARQEAQKTASAENPVTVSIGKGKYFMKDPVWFGPEDSNVTYVGDNAVLTGAKTLESLEWQDYNGRIKVAEVEKNMGIDQLFVDGRQQIMARYPNYNPEQALQGCTTQSDIKARSAGWTDPSGGYIRALHENKWGGNSYKITGKDNSALGLSYEWIGDNNRGSGMRTTEIMVENIFEELDSPGEWYYDGEAGRLYLYPEENTDLDNAVIEGAVTEELLHVEGIQDGAQVTNLVFDGLTLENTKRTMFTGTYVPLMRSDWCVVRSGALFIQDAENVAFKNGIIRNIGGNGVFLSGHSKNVSVDNNEIINIGSSGILAAGFPDSCREPSFWDNIPAPEVSPYYVHKTTINDATPGPAEEHYPREAVISNNHIQNVGIWEKQSSHVALSVAYRIQILHNTMHEGPRAGVNIGEGTFGGHELAYNDIFDVQKETDDHGMFNSWGRDRFWSLGGYDTNGNNGAEKEPYSLIDVIEPITIHDNRMHFGGRVDGGTTFGIDLDDGSTNYRIYNNLCLNMGIKLREGFHREVYNNILVNGQINLHCTYEDSFDVIKSNIIVKGSPYALAATDEQRFAVSEDEINNNCFYDLGMQVNLPDFWKNLGYDENSVNRDPLFRDTADNDYTVTNEDLMEEIGFVNFDMDQFGKPGCEYQSPIYEKTEPDGNEDMLGREEWLGATVSALNDAIMSSAGAGGLDGVYFESVPENSQAAKYGFETGDVLKSLNGDRIGEKANFTSMFNKIGNGRVVNCGLIRNQLQMELNFVKISSETLIDDQDEAIQYIGGVLQESTPEYNAPNAVDCIDKTLSAIHVAVLENPEQVAVRVPFSGSQIEFYSRKENNMGDYRIVITDKAGKIVQDEICSAYTDGKEDAQLIFRSDIFPFGDYTLELTWISGDYVIVDAFKVFSYESENGDAVVVEPVSVTDEGVRVTELVSDRELDIQIPVKNNSLEDIMVAADVVLSGGAGAMRTESIRTESLVISGGDTRMITFTVRTPQKSEGKRLEIYIYNSRSGRIYAYPLVIEGGALAAGEVSILDAVSDGIAYTYTSDSRILTVSAKGFAQEGQALVRVQDNEGTLVGLRQVRVDTNGLVKAAFILPEETEGSLLIEVQDETGSSKEQNVQIEAGINILDKSALETAVEKARPVIESETDRGIYTKDSWMEFYNAYYNALERIESDAGAQEDVAEKAELLSRAQKSLKKLADDGEYVPCNATRGTLFEVYGADGEKDGGNYDAGSGSWMVRDTHSDTTVYGAYAEFKGNFTSFAIYGADKYDSADFKVVITDDVTEEEEVDEITLSRDSYHETIYNKTGMNTHPKTIRVYHNDTSGQYRYLELHQISYTVWNNSAEEVPALESIKVTKLPDITVYDKGYEGKISFLGGEITETYSDQSTNVIPMNSLMYKSGFDTSEGGMKSITVNHNGKTADFNITVREPLIAVTGAKIDIATPKTGDTLNVTVTPADAEVTYSWRADGIEVGTGDSYQVMEEDVGKKITVMVTGISDYTGIFISEATAPVEGGQQEPAEPEDPGQQEPTEPEDPDEQDPPEVKDPAQSNQPDVPNVSEEIAGSCEQNEQQQADSSEKAETFAVQTGDSTQIVFWVMIMAGAVLVTAAVKLTKRKVK